jgi:acetate kinase
MGFTPASGVMMATRSGDIDPGLAAYLAQSEAMTPAQFNHMVNFESGLLGVSQSSGDMQVLLDRSLDDTTAADAVNLYCHLVKQRLGAFAATLGGLDTLVFSGGIGENAPAIRAQICDGLGFLGIALDAGRNRAGEAVISATNAVTVRVIATDEEAMIAHHIADLVGHARPAA